MRWIPLLIILIVSFLFALYTLFNIKDFNRKRFWFASLLYITFLGTILFTPLSFTGTSVFVMPAGTGTVNLHRIYYDLGFVENIVLTIPLGFLIKRLSSKISWVSMIPIGLLTGASIETAQYFLSHMFYINRTSDISDVVANGIGIVIGATFMVIYQFVLDKKLLNKWI